MSKFSVRKAIVVGASSGMGREVARLLLNDGWTVGLVARRGALLESLATEYIVEDHSSEAIEDRPSEGRSMGHAIVREIDVTADDADVILRQLIDEMGGIDLYFHAAGVGWQNHELEKQKELRTVAVNGMGFARMVGEVYRYFASVGHGQIAVISSIAGTKGLGPAPAYSATKAFENVYLQALEQQARTRGLDIYFTDIRPGFVRTALIDDGTHYPMVLDPVRVAKRIVAAIYARKHVVVIDWRWGMLTCLWRLLPNWIWRRFALFEADRSD
jgi:short-subunit dehydrogenase